MSLNIMAECEDCKSKFELSDKVVKKEECKDNDKSIWVTYYDCPDCGRRHYVQVDDTDTNLMLTEIKREKVLMICNKRKGVYPSKKQLAKHNRKEVDLANSRMRLKQLYDKREVSFGNEKVLTTLRFSI